MPGHWQKLKVVPNQPKKLLNFMYFDVISEGEWTFSTSMNSRESHIEA